MTTPICHDDHQAIRLVIQDYFEGVSSADRAPLDRAWDAGSGHWKGVVTDPGRVETVKVEPIADSIRRWAAGTPGTSTGRIVALEVIDGQLAIVKFELQLGDERFLDVLSLYKVNGTWKLVNKVFVRR
ncbi:nuclear transport factor 2 family protein [Paracoccus spongiarum]|uniref:Nuclear transport factor 2 family protein n=1 Tax=Paracoccus spongiarum TaxID=3064387 RepID=A0ABT9JAE2_9RHOB|nr:nuclear transport factor 2 family protein [Paracoccus sp. 2205BS29-5]MDP5306789.1 nuclear transport factor 2 family protein [Paracoccus sp. 2205BS29-5]